MEGVPPAFPLLFFYNEETEGISSNINLQWQIYGGKWKYPMLFAFGCPREEDDASVSIGC
jgi:hypothetical protein